MSEQAKWMRLVEAAQYARVATSLLRKLIRNEQLPPIKTGGYYIVDREDLDACLGKMKRRSPQRRSKS